MTTLRDTKDLPKEFVGHDFMLITLALGLLQARLEMDGEDDETVSRCDVLGNVYMGLMIDSCETGAGANQLMDEMRTLLHYTSAASRVSLIKEDGHAGQN